MDAGERMIDTRIHDRFGELVFSEAVVGMAMVGLDGKWLRVNRAFCSLLGYTEAELQHRTWMSVTHPDDVDDDSENVRRVIDGEQRDYTMWKRYLPKAGPPLMVKLRVMMHRDDQGNAVCFLSQATPHVVPPSVAVAQPAGSRRMAVGEIPAFMRRNWQWLLPVGTAVTAGVWAVFRWIVEQLGR